MAATAAMAMLLPGGAAAIAAAATSSRVPSRLSEAQILNIALAAARRAGDSTPTLIQHSEGSHGKANLLTCGCGVPGGEASYLIAERGHFTAYEASPPLGVPLPTGSVLTLIINAATGDGTDWGVSNRYPNLAALGPVTTDLGVPPPAAGAVRLELRPRLAHPGSWLQIVIVNASRRPIVWGGCWAWQHQLEWHWQGAPFSCAAYVPFGARSRTTKVLRLADSVRPGQYRIGFVYRDAPATTQQPEQIASANLTVVPPVAPPATGKGILTGAIRFVGGRSTVKRTPLRAGEVIVASLTRRRVVAREHVLAGHSFRFTLSPGGYELRTLARSNCARAEAIVDAGRTTRVDVDVGCSIP